MFSSLHQALTSKAVSLQYHCEDLVILPANYRSHLRKASTFHTIMPTNVQEIPPKEVNVLNKNTGFPEPLNPGMPSLHARNAETDVPRPQYYSPSPRRRHLSECHNRSTRRQSYAHSIPQFVSPSSTSKQKRFRQGRDEGQRPV
jgi:hypothetical protein